jgi:hypothetical protein
MKFICCFFVAIVLFGCHNDPPAAAAHQINPLLRIHQINPPDGHPRYGSLDRSVCPLEKTPAEIYDGSYDSVSSFFLPCGKIDLIKVMKDHIDFDMISNCDTSLGSRIKLFDLKMGDSFAKILPHQVDLKTNSYFKSGGETIILKPAQQVRVRRAVAVRKDMYIKKQMIKKEN